MKPKTLVLMFVAVACGLGASYMTSRLLAERQTDEVQRVTVLVAKRNINMGDTIKNPQDLFEPREFNVGEEPKDALRDWDSLKGRVLKIPRRAGDFVRPEDLLGSNDPAAFFQAHLPSGYRAMGLRVNLENSASGWATQPLSRVDIVNTIRRGDDKSTHSGYLLENVLVLAIDGTTARDESGRALPGQVVIFALSPEDVLKLNIAREIGILTLAVRKMNDVQRSPIEKLTLEDLRQGNQNTMNGPIEMTSIEGAPGGFGSVPPALPAFGKNPVTIEDPVAVPKVEAPKLPEGNRHDITITEGGASRTASFLLDRNGRVVNQEVTRTELPPADEK